MHQCWHRDIKMLKKNGICTSKVNSSIFGSPVVPNNTRKWIIRICMWVIQATGQGQWGWPWHCTHDSASETRTAVRASNGTAQTLNWPIVLHDSRHTLVALQWHCTEDVSVETAKLTNVSNESQASTVHTRLKLCRIADCIYYVWDNLYADHTGALNLNLHITNSLWVKS